MVLCEKTNLFSLFVAENDDAKIEEEFPVNSRIDLEELIIENNKRLITTNNRWRIIIDDDIRTILCLSTGLSKKKPCMKT